MGCYIHIQRRYKSMNQEGRLGRVFPLSAEIAHWCVIPYHFTPSSLRLGRRPGSGLA